MHLKMIFLKLVNLVILTFKNPLFLMLFISKVTVILRKFEHSSYLDEIFSANKK